VDKCNESQWPDKDHDLVCSDCKVLVNQFSTKYKTCDAYCKTMHMDCAGAWEEEKDTCAVKHDMTCQQTLNSSDAICECKPKVCNETQWPDKDHGTVCGDCKVLVDKFSSKYKTCQGYCKTIGMDCANAWEESGDSCTVKHNMTCSQTLNSSDAICECKAGKWMEYTHDGKKAWYNTETKETSWSNRQESLLEQVPGISSATIAKTASSALASQIPSFTSTNRVTIPIKLPDSFKQKAGTALTAYRFLVEQDGKKMQMEAANMVESLVKSRLQEVQQARDDQAQKCEDAVEGKEQQALAASQKADAAGKLFAEAMKKAAKASGNKMVQARAQEAGVVLKDGGASEVAQAQKALKVASENGGQLVDNLKSLTGAFSMASAFR